MKRKVTVGFLMLVLITGLMTGCGAKKESQFQSYVQSLITANYLGTSDEYIKTTGVNEADAEALYLQNVNRLSENLMSYYGLDLSGNADIGARMTEVSKLIYSKIRFEVSPTRMENGIYYVDVTIHPINILNDTHDAVVACIGEFNKKVKAGEYNDVTKEEYEKALASGIIDILENGAKEMTYRDPETVTVRIIEGKTSFYISDDDFRALDALVIATIQDEPKNTEPDSEQQEEGTTEKKVETFG